MRGIGFNGQTGTRHSNNLDSIISSSIYAYIKANYVETIVEEGNSMVYGVVFAPSPYTAYDVYDGSDWIHSPPISPT